MWGRTHGEVGALAGASLAAASGRPEDMLPCAVIGYVAGLLPDIDKRKTTITKVPLLNLITIPLSWILSRKALTGGHRGVVHQWPGLLVWTALAYAAHLRGVFLLAFALGYLLHILCDMTTVSGVRFLWPLKMAHITPEGLRLNMEHPGEAAGRRRWAVGRGARAPARARAAGADAAHGCGPAVLRRHAAGVDERRADAASFARLTPE